MKKEMKKVQMQEVNGGIGTLVGVGMCLGLGFVAVVAAICFTS